MPAPHDQRFCIIFQVAQQNNTHTDQQLLALFESALEQVLKDEPSLAEDEALPKAMRSWCRIVIPEESMPEFLNEDVRLKRSPRFGDAVVIPSQAKGTFWWNRQAKKVEWVWWDPDPSRPGQIIHREPQSAAGGLSEGQVRGAKHSSPGIVVKTEPQDNQDGLKDDVVSGIGQAGSDRGSLGCALPGSVEGNEPVQKEKESLPDSLGSPKPEQYTLGTTNSRSVSIPTTPSQQDSPSDNINNSGDTDQEDDIFMMDNASSASRERSVDEESTSSPRSYAVHPPSRSTTPGTPGMADTSVVHADRPNEYYTIQDFIFLKAEKEEWNMEEVEDRWQRCLDHCIGEYGERGRAYVQYMLEYNIWITLYHNTFAIFTEIDHFFIALTPHATLASLKSLLALEQLLGNKMASSAMSEASNGPHPELVDVDVSLERDLTSMMTSFNSDWFDELASIPESIDDSSVTDDSECSPELLLPTQLTAQSAESMEKCSLEPQDGPEDYGSQTAVSSTSESLVYDSVRADDHNTLTEDESIEFELSSETSSCETFSTASLPAKPRRRLYIRREHPNGHRKHQAWMKASALPGQKNDEEQTDRPGTTNSAAKQGRNSRSETSAVPQSKVPASFARSRKRKFVHKDHICYVCGSRHNVRKCQVRKPKGKKSKKGKRS
ncbi:hypothetical protein BKA64DRAFT_700337 [Cadophora sp. MPI-SDFR-AT-0126]|nr:hypothetical protein BKA64DRAFT_700337 [Leotiomycetes sp. MPI-SDFR-AT-0126]